MLLLTSTSFSSQPLLFLKDAAAAIQRKEEEGLENSQPFYPNPTMGMHAL